MPAYMFDGAFDADMIDECKAAGAIALSHYLTGTHAGTSAQPHAIRAAGMGAVLNYERAANELVGASRAKGQEVAWAALAGVDGDCPRDGTVAVYFSVDVNVALRDITACDQGFAGINDVLGSAFIPKTYAEGALIDHLVGKGLVRGKQWLSASSSYPGYNPNSDNVCMVQQVGTFVPKTDRNLITDPSAIGAWWPAGHTPPAPSPPIPMEDIMAILVYPGVNGKGGTIGALDSGMRFRAFTSRQWAAVNSVRAKLPAASRPPVVKITQTEYANLPR